MNDIRNVEEAKDILYSILRVLTDYSNEEIRAYIEIIEKESPKMSIAELQKEIEKLKEEKGGHLNGNYRITYCSICCIKDCRRN